MFTGDCFVWLTVVVFHVKLIERAPTLVETTSHYPCKYTLVIGLMINLQQFYKLEKQIKDMQSMPILCFYTNSLDGMTP